MSGNIFQTFQFSQSGPQADKQLWPELPKYVFVIFIFIAGFLLYYFSIKFSFIPVRYLEIFGNDHQWIVLQSKLSSSRHHQHHLLYHIIVRQVRALLWINSITRDPIFAFKIVSAFFGASGLVLFYFCMVKLALNQGIAQFFTLMLGLSASYFFFSATVDTYIPAVAASIVVMICLINCLTSEKQSNYVYLGFALGLAVLFRLDNVLLVPLAFIPIILSRKKLLNCAYCSIGLIVGALAYVVLAKYIYHINYVDIFDWVISLGSRVDKEEKGLAELANFNLVDFMAVIKSHFLHSFIFESGYRINGDSAAYVYGAIVKKVLTICFIAITLSVIALFAVKVARNSIKITGIYRNVILILICWIVVRISFYLWFNPVEPFVFTPSTIAPIWALIALMTAGVFESSPPSRFNFRYLLWFWLISLGSSNFIFVLAELYKFD